MPCSLILFFSFLSRFIIHNMTSQKTIDPKTGSGIRKPTLRYPPYAWKCPQYHQSLMLNHGSWWLIPTSNDHHHHLEPSATSVHKNRWLASTAICSKTCLTYRGLESWCESNSLSGSAIAACKVPRSPVKIWKTCDNLVYLLTIGVCRRWYLGTRLENWVLDGYSLKPQGSTAPGSK